MGCMPLIVFCDQMQICAHVICVTFICEGKLTICVSNHREYFDLHPVNFRRQVPGDNNHFVFISFQTLMQYSVLFTLHKTLHIIIYVVVCHPYDSCSAKKKEYSQLFANPCMIYFITDGGCMHDNKYKTYFKFFNVLKVTDISTKYSLCKKTWMECSAYNLNGKN